MSTPAAATSSSLTLARPLARGRLLASAAGYDDSSTGGTRILAKHTHWLAQFACSVLKLRGDLPVAERVAAVLAALRQRHLFK